MESGLKIIDSPNYLLYNDPEQYLRRNVLPLSVACEKCESRLVVDLVGDVYWTDKILKEAEYALARRQVDRQRKSSMFLGDTEYLDYAYPYPKKREYYCSGFYSYCPVCRSRIQLVFPIPDAEPIEKFVQNYHKHPSKNQHKRINVLSSSNKVGEKLGSTPVTILIFICIFLVCCVFII